MANNRGLAAGVRDVNSAALLDAVRRDGPTTRTELLTRSGLSKATVSVIVGDLLERGLIRETGRLQQGRGRSRAVLEFDPAARTVAGAQLDDEACEFVLTDLYGNPYHRHRVSLPGTDPDRVLAAVADGFRTVRKAATSPVVGLGLGTPGNVDRDGRRVVVALTHGWQDLPVADLLEVRLGVPVVIANRAKVAALGVIGHGQPDGPQDLIYVYLGSGIIAGIVIDRRLYFGRDGSAGDIGHVTVRTDGELCSCGNRGCLHTFASQEAILGGIRSRLRQADEPEESILWRLTGGALASLTVDHLAEAAAAGDELALAAVDQVGGSLGLVIANLINTLNPDSVIIGGPTTRLGAPLLASIEAEVRRRSLSESRRDLDLSLSGEENGPAGAAALWLSRRLDDSYSLNRILSDELEGTP